MVRQSWRGEWKLGRCITTAEAAKYGLDEETALALSMSAETALECIRKAPALHIISLFTGDKNHFYNRYIPDADAYYLADGDRNPDLFKVCEPLCTADIEELEQLMRDTNEGQLSVLDQSLVRFLRMLLTNTVNLDALVDPEHRRQVREMEMEEAKWKRDEDLDLPQPSLLKKA